MHPNGIYFTIVLFNVVQFLSWKLNLSFENLVLILMLDSMINIYYDGVLILILCEVG